MAVEFDAGYPFAQVYAPADAGFVCLEPMTAPANALISGDQPAAWRPASASPPASPSHVT